MTASTCTHLWVDDERPAPDTSWDLATTSAEAAATFDADRHTVVSLDYSLGRGDTAENVIKHWATTGSWPAEVRLHSGNRDGRTLLAAIIGDHFPDGDGPVIVGL